MTAIRVVRPGLFTTVQDLGRVGFQHLGVPTSGAMDATSHRLANALVGNSDADATLECTLVGPELLARGPLRLAVTGAECTISVDGARHQVPCVFDAVDGSRIAIGAATRGARMYVAVSGGFDTPMVLGSRSTDVRSGLGAYGGRMLAAGDELPVGIRRGDQAQRPTRISAAASWLPHPGVETMLRVVPGPQADAALPLLTASALTLSSRCDRVGYRFEDRLQARGPGNLVSMPVAFGTIQVTPSGEVILLMADRQTVGGYAQVATLATADRHVAGQLTPGCRVRFAECSPADAALALRRLESSHARIERTSP
jgi:antagonist of KipI